MMNTNSEMVIRLERVTKQYAKHTAVQELSLSIPRGEIYGILGPNGAGKTSSIRMMTGITRPDSGQIYFNEQPLEARHIERMGYMPEERGLYKKMKVGEQILYLARLKGLSKAEAKAKLEHWAERLDIGTWLNKPIEDLSKGMQQKVQFICTVVHEPDFLILDEPFSGLDPVNATLIQDEIHALQQRGTTILFSTHRMEQVEKICERIVLIHRGQNVLEGRVAEIKQRYKSHRYGLRFAGELPFLANPRDLPPFHWVEQAPGQAWFELEVPDEQAPSRILQALLEAGLCLQHFEEELPSLNDIFVKVVNQA